MTTSVEGSLKKVLVVDDNADLRTIFARVFDHNHFSVHIAVDGIEALELIEAEPPDILILDVNMPRLNGFEVLRLVRENPQAQHTKIVLVTGNTIAVQAPEAEAADLLLIKPVSIDDLIRLSRRLTAV